MWLLWLYRIFFFGRPATLTLGRVVSRGRRPIGRFDEDESTSPHCILRGLPLAVGFVVNRWDVLLLKPLMAWGLSASSGHPAPQRYVAIVGSFVELLAKSWICLSFFGSLPSMLLAKEFLLAGVTIAGLWLCVSQTLESPGASLA